MTKLKGSADDKPNVTEKLKFVLGRLKNNVGKAFFPFPTMFSKGIYVGVIKWLVGCVGV